MSFSLCKDKERLWNRCCVPSDSQVICNIFLHLSDRNSEALMLISPPVSIAIGTRWWWTALSLALSAGISQRIYIAFTAGVCHAPWMCLLVSLGWPVLRYRQCKGYCQIIYTIYGSHRMAFWSESVAVADAKPRRLLMPKYFSTSSQPYKPVRLPGSIIINVLVLRNLKSRNANSGRNSGQRLCFNKYFSLCQNIAAPVIWVNMRAYDAGTTSTRLEAPKVSNVFVTQTQTT